MLKIIEDFKFSPDREVVKDHATDVIKTVQTVLDSGTLNSVTNIDKPGPGDMMVLNITLPEHGIVVTVVKHFK